MEDKDKRCKHCWWAHEATERCMVNCWWFHQELYAESLPCPEYADSCPVF